MGNLDPVQGRRDEYFGQGAVRSREREMVRAQQLGNVLERKLSQKKTQGSHRGKGGKA